MAGRKKTSKKKTAKRKPSCDDDVVEFSVTLSISQISRETGFTRETVSKKIDEVGVAPAGKRRGYPVYRLRDVLPVLYQSQDGVFDPDKLKPFERRAYYQGEMDKLKLQLERGECCLSIEVERKIGRLFKIVAQALDTLPDILERDVGLGVKQLAYVEKIIDQCREEMYREVMADTDDDADSAAEISG